VDITDAANPVPGGVVAFPRRELPRAGHLPAGRVPRAGRQRRGLPAADAGQGPHLGDAGADLPARHRRGGAW
jgi:hypothetical protein